MGNVSAPPGGLASGSNYFITAGGADLPNPSATVTIDDLLVAGNGFSIQMNCQPTANQNMVWLQFGFVFSPQADGTSILQYFVNLWPSSAYAATLNLPAGAIVDVYVTMIQGIPPGNLGPCIYPTSQFEIELGQGTGSEIAAVRFTYTDSYDVQTQTKWIDLVGLPYSKNANQNLAAPGLCPMTSFQLVIAGQYNDMYAYLAEGGGHIQYASNPPISPSGTQPPHYVGTGETSGCVYASMAQETSQTLTQTFSVVQAPPYTPGGRFAVSQQVGLNQTNLYGIDRAGQFVVFWADGSGHWSWTMPAGPVGWARPWAALAASQQFGANQQTNVFVIGQNSHLSTFWVEGTGAWQGPVDISALLKVDDDRHITAGGNLAVSQQFGAPDQTDVFAIDSTGALNVYWVQSAGSWGGPVVVGAAGLFEKGAPLAASQQAGAPNQTDVFAVDVNGTLRVFWVQGLGQWSQDPPSIGPAGKFKSGAFVAATPGFDAPDRTDVYVVDTDGTICVFSVTGTGAWSSEPTFIGPAQTALSGAPLSVCQRAGVPGQTDVYVVDKTGTVQVFSRPPGIAWTRAPGTPVGPAGLAPTEAQSSPHSIGSYIVASPQYGVAGQTDVFVMCQNGANGPGWPTVCWTLDDDAWNGPGALQAQV